MGLALPCLTTAQAPIQLSDQDQKVGVTSAVPVIFAHAFW
jgi:hypothetical protein